MRVTAYPAGGAAATVAVGVPTTNEVYAITTSRLCPNHASIKRRKKL
jgi:hypothetical protein